MPGGDKAIQEPWRMAAAYLHDAFGDNFLKLGIPFTRKIKEKDWNILKYMIDKGLNSPSTSSVGRLFDAVSSIILSIFKVENEAEAPVRLQRLAEVAKAEEGSYKVKLNKDNPDIKNKILVPGCPPDINKMADALRKAGIDADQVIFDNYETAGSIFMSRYEGRPEFSHEFYRIMD